MAALRAAGLLGFRGYPWLKDGPLHFSSRKGNRCLAEIGLLSRSHIADCPRPAEEPGPALRHDLNVIDLRLGLEESGADGRTWVSDHQLRIQRRAMGSQERVPDGVFEFRRGPTQEQGLLEYEHSPYHRSSIAALLARLRDRYEGHTLFVVCPSLKRADTFRAWAAGSRAYDDAPDQIAFSWREPVAKDGLDGGFVDLWGHPWGRSSND